MSRPPATSRRKRPFARRRRAPLVVRAVPLVGAVAGYGRDAARRDLLSGATVAALAIPSAMAYAELSGVSPVSGLYALVLPVAAYAVFGSSRQVIVGPEGSLAALTAAAVLGAAVAGSTHAAELATTLALLVGCCFVLARILRLGWVADYFSRPVLIGYLHGVAVVLVVGQLGKLLGVPVDATEPLAQLEQVARQLGEVSGVTIAVSAASLTVLLAVRHLWPGLPTALIVVVAAIAVSALVDLAAYGVATVGTVPAGLPKIAVPATSLDETLGVLPDAIGIFLVCFADGILTARAFAGKRAEHIRVGRRSSRWAPLTPRQGSQAESRSASAALEQP